jgi:hypothetical protein
MARLVSLAVLLAAVPFTPCLAQTHAVDRGAWQLGGSVRITGFRDIGNDTRSFVLDLNPRVGYFILPGLAVTANLQLARASNDNGHTSTYGVGPGVTYYFGGGPRRFLPFLSGRTLWVQSTSYADAGGSASLETWDWLVSGGALFLVAKNVGVTGEVFYSHSHVTFDGIGPAQSNSSEEYGTQLGVAVYLF